MLNPIDDPLRDRIYDLHLHDRLAAIVERVRSSPALSHQAADGEERETYALTRAELTDIETMAGEIRELQASDEWYGIIRPHRDSHITAEDRRAYRKKLRVFVEYLDEFLSITGPNGPPDFAAALASRDPGIGDEAYAIWIALFEAMGAAPREMPSNDIDSLDDWSGPAGLWLKALPRLDRCLRLRLNLSKSWQIPDIRMDRTGVVCVGNLYRVDGEDWQPITPCTMKASEHKLLTRDRNILELLSRERSEDEDDDEQAKSTGKARQTRLIAHLDVDPPVIMLDGKPVEAFDPVITHYVADLIELNGGRRSVPEFLRLNPQHQGYEESNTKRFLDVINDMIILKYIDICKIWSCLKVKKLM